MLQGLLPSRPQAVRNIRSTAIEDAGVMAARGLLFGDYWARNSGDWGFAGSQDVQRNIYGRRPTLGERGLLYSTSKWLS